MYEKIEKYIDRLLTDSTPDKPVWNIEKILLGKPAAWNYIDGCIIAAFLDMAMVTGDAKYSDFAENFIDYYVKEDGSLLGWHKLIYPNQIWLDGIYMAQVFYVRYLMEFGDNDLSDIMSQIKNVRRLMFDENKKLYYHGCDCSKSIFWADRETGCSKNFWLRSIGWFTVALADIIGYINNDEYREELIGIFRETIKGIALYADPESGLYYQVVDCGGKEGNYLETSGSSMIAYAMLKGVRLKVLDEEYLALGKKTFDGICDKYLTVSENGELNLGGICLVAGLGPENKPNRDGSYEYYISEPVVENDAKGVAPFLMCYTEVERLQ